MRLKDAFRTFMGIRVERALPTPGLQPPTGSNIALGKLRMRLKMPIDGRQWIWLTANGWRTIDMRNDRRRYRRLPDEALERLLEFEGAERDEFHRELLAMYGGAGIQRSGSV